MRNLKRALSLTLASVMLLGMMVVGSSAAVGYPDVAEDDNVEAIEVVQSVGVMVGDENGNFRPADTVSRAEMAVVMGKLLNLDYNYYEAVCPFTDVAGVYDWARGWVGAAAANGIVSGRGDGIYDPAATVTAVEAASMMMRALGYFKYQNDYADGFEVSTVRQGTTIGIFNGVGSSATAPMTRNQVAQMVLNALQSDVVEPDGNTTTFLNPDGTVLATTGKVNYVSVTRDEPFATAISRTQATSVGSQNSGWIVELGERLYNGDLKLYDTVNTTDDFERPSRTWEYDGKEIGTYMKKENIRAEYTTAVTARTLYDLLGRTILQEYDFAYYVDGVLAEGSATTVLNRQTNDYGATGRGVLTQVFVDVENETIDITSINTYLAQAAMNYNSTTESVSLNIFSDAQRSGSSPNFEYNTYNATKNVSKVDVPEIEGLEQDDYLLVNVSGKDNNATYVVDDLDHIINLSNYDVVAAYDVEILTDSTLTKFSKRNSDSDINSDSNQALFSSVVTGGTEYKSSAKAYYSDDVLDLYDNDLLVGKSYNIYLDRYGYAIGIDLFEGENNYVFITGFDPSGSNIAYGNASAAAIFADGTQDVITVNVKATNENIDRVDGYEANGSRVASTDPNYRSYFEKWGSITSMKSSPYALNRWYTYTVNANGVYTLQPATRMITTEVVDDDYPNGELIIKTNSVRIDENASIADDTYTGTTVQGDGMNGWAAGKTDTRVFGNDNSVYIVVDPDDMEEVDESIANVLSKPTGAVITEVSGVYTGVQNVEINVETVDNAGDGITGTALYDSIYTVYDKNNYIIASVVIGEARGDNANYAYILTAATSEEYIADGGHVWTFDAIVDGVRTTLTTNDKFTSVIGNLQPGHIQELRFSGDYVSSVSTPNDKTKYYDYTDATTARIDKEEIYDVGHNPAPGNGSYDCVTSSHVDPVSGTYVDEHGHLTKVIDGTTNEYVYEANDLTIVGNTMYFRRVDVAGTDSNSDAYSFPADYGLALASDAKGIIIHQVDGSWKVLADGYTVAQAISELKDPVDSTVEKEFEGRIVAALNGQGAAKWVIFISENGVTTPGGGSVNTQNTIRVNRILDTNNNIVDTVILTKNSLGTITVANEPALALSGYTPITPTITVTEANRVQGETRTYQVNLFYTKTGGPNPGGNEETAYTVSFDVNGGTGDAPDEMTWTIGTSDAGDLPAIDGVTKTGYVFAGWGTKSDEDPDDVVGNTGGDNENWDPDDDAELFAIWVETHDLTLPTGYSYAWTAVNDYIDAQTTTASDGSAVAVPEGASVTVTVPVANTFYVKFDAADETSYTKGGQTYTFTQGAGNNDHSNIENNKYYHVEMDTYAGATVGGVAFTASATAKYMKDGTFTITITSAAGGTTNATVSATVAGDNSVTTDITSDQQYDNGDTVAAGATKDITITPDFTSASSADITLTLTLD